jgi:hypothetical protein
MSVKGWQSIIWHDRTLRNPAWSYIEGRLHVATVRVKISRCGNRRFWEIQAKLDYVESISFWISLDLDFWIAELPAWTHISATTNAGFRITIKAGPALTAWHLETLGSNNKNNNENRAKWSLDAEIGLLVGISHETDENGIRYHA